MATAMLTGYHNIHGTPRFAETKCQVELTVQEIERFWSKVARGAKGLCWLWTASLCGGGGIKHGQFSVYRRQAQGKRKQFNFKAHRVAWEQVNGPIPDGLCVCHKCDVPVCCNPDHLFLGTQQDNLADARQKGRLDESNFRKPFTLEAYRAIVLTNERGVDIARRFGVTRCSISRIRHGYQGHRVVQRILQDHARQPQSRLSTFDVLDQSEQPLSLGKVR